MTKTKDKRAGVLFDLDGVLLDTEGMYTEFWGAINKAFPTGVPNFELVIKGSNLEAILNTYFSPADHGRIVEMLHDFQKDMPYRFFPGAEEWLQRLQEAGIPMAVVTSSDQKKMDAVYRQHPHFTNYFKAVIVGDMVHDPKPHPECYLMGAEHIGVDIKDCWVFEDSINGLVAGKRSGAHVIGLDTTVARQRVAEHASLVLSGFEGFTVEQMLQTT